MLLVPRLGQNLLERASLLLTRKRMLFSLLFKKLMLLLHELLAFESG